MTSLEGMRVAVVASPEVAGGLRALSARVFEIDAADAIAPLSTAIASAAAKAGGLDALVVCGERTAFDAETDAEAFDAAIASTTRRLFLASAAGVPVLVDGGSVVHVVSALLDDPLDAATRGSGVVLTRGLAGEVAPRVRVNAVLAGRDAEPGDIASAVAFLVAHGSGFLTGVCLEVERAARHRTA